MSKQDNYKNIKDSFETGFENISNKELVHRYKGIDNLYGRQDIQLEMSRRLIDETNEFNINSSRQSKVMIRLTRWIAGLTIAMLIIGIIQIILLFTR